MEIEKLIKQSKFVDEYQKAMINLIYTSNFFRDIHLSIFNKHKIQGQHFNILRILKGKHPEPVSPGYIKDVMLDKGRDLTRLIDKLVSMGWVSRNVCPGNKRKMDISLSDKGMDMIDQLTNEVNLKDQEVRFLSDSEYKQLSELLDKMRG